ncbi:hypothetical protein A0256_23390 [Mucilaginibacter sp. PAMC 26640]|nr:hypothetical protein A0256_23390 [Mucilaginibacter sp. PAMC 26640]
MGQMIKCFYLGAYLEVASDDFQEKKVEDNFYDEVSNEHFIQPYQGLEDLNILIPSVDDYKSTKDLEGEFTLCESDLNLSDLAQKFKDGYVDQISIVEKYFPYSVTIKTGLVCYWDEIA